MPTPSRPPEPAPRCVLPAAPPAALPIRLPAALLGALLLALLATGCARIAGEPFQPTHNAALPLSEGASLGQTFQVPSGAVAGVDVLTATYGTTPPPDATLVVRLLDAPGGEVLAEVEVPGSDVPDNAWVTATFPAPVAVEGTAAVVLTWDAEAPVAVRANVPGPDRTEAELLNDPYPGGELLRDGAAATGDLAFRVRGEPGPGDAVATVGRLLRGAAAGVVARPLFAVLWSALLAGCLVLAVVGFRRGARTE